MARGRVYTTLVTPGYRTTGYRITRGRPYRLMTAEVRDKDGRIVWTDNTRFGRRTHADMLESTNRVVAALRVLEALGHRLEWDWQGCVDRAPRL